MKTIKRILILTVMIDFLFMPVTFSRNLKRLNYKEGELIIKYVNEADVDHIIQNEIESDALSAKSSGKKRIRSMSKIMKGRGLAKLQLQAVESLEVKMEELRQDPRVEYVQRNYIYTKQATPNDPQFTTQWGLNPSSTNHIQANTAWDKNINCTSVVVAILDSGIQYNHEDLKDNLWSSPQYPKYGYDFIQNDNDPMDLNGHGTHVAGIVGARGGNTQGISGVCWQAKLMAVRVLDAAGSGTSEQVVKGIDFAIAQGAKIMNMSFGIEYNFTLMDNIIKEALLRAKNAGIIVVAAAGNEAKNNDPVSEDEKRMYPCSYDFDNIICVGSVDSAYALSSFSNFGSTSVDIMAPGSSILSTYFVSSTPQLGSNINDWTQHPSVTSGGDWGYDVYSNLKVLVNPKDTFSNSGSTYLANANNSIYKTLPAPPAGINNWSWNFITDQIMASGDVIEVAAVSGSKNPFSTTSSTGVVSGAVILGTLSGDSFGSVSKSYSLNTACPLTQPCSVGYRLRSNSSSSIYELGIVLYNIEVVSTGNAGYKSLNGTSMATPYVAGLAALVWSYLPTYTYKEVIDAITKTGDVKSSLAGKSVTSAVINANKAMSYLAPPEVVSATAVVVGP